MRDRKQRIVHSNVTCNWKTINKGTTQGPYLFIIILKVPITPSQTFFLKSRPQIQAKASNKIEFEVIPDFLRRD